MTEENGQDVKVFGKWTISRGSERRDKTRPWVARKDNVVLMEETWPDLKERIQARVN